MPNNTKTKVDIAVLQERVEEIGEDVKTILGNHLPHLKAELDDLKFRIAYWMGGLAAIGFVLQLAIAYFKK